MGDIEAATYRHAMAQDGYDRAQGKAYDEDACRIIARRLAEARAELQRVTTGAALVETETDKLARMLLHTQKPTTEGHEQ